MSDNTRESFAFAVLVGEPLPGRADQVARKRAREILARTVHSDARLVDLLATAYVLGIEDCAEARSPKERQ